MKNLNYYKEIIKEKRKQTNFRNYLKEIVTWQPIVFHKVNGLISRFPKTNRIGGIINFNDFDEKNTAIFYSGINYNGNFFKDFQKLFSEVKLPNMVNFFNSENSTYADVVNKSKNAYLSSIVISECENVLYSLSVKDNSVNIFNSVMVNIYSENIYFSTGITKSFNIFYSKYINNSNNIWFSSNLVGCSECINCNNLENSSYYINNKKYEKEEYLKLKEELLKNKSDFLSKYKKLDSIGNNIASDNVSGNCIIESENIENGNFVNNVLNGRNIIFTGGKNGNENMYDIFNGGAPSANNIYGVNGVANGSENIFIGANLPACNNVYYSLHLQNCSYCIGCIGLKNKSYCILNKQFTKNEWEKEAVKIFSQMEQDGTLGNFFPGELNPFYFNDTVAGLIGGFKKEEVMKEGYMWRDDEIKVDIPEGIEVIKTIDLGKYEGFDNEGNWKINPKILKVVIIDEKGNYYRIVQMEYDFLVKYGLPLPRIHWLDRIKLGFGV